MLESYHCSLYLINPGNLKKTAWVVKRRNSFLSLYSLYLFSSRCFEHHFLGLFYTRTTRTKNYR